MAARQSGVTVEGLTATKRAMRLAAPDLKKDMDRTIRSLLQPIALRAKRNVEDDPLIRRWEIQPRRPGSRPSYSPYGRRWDYERLQWNPEAMRSDIRVRQGGRRARGTIERAAWSIRSNHPAAAVWELMGRGKSNVSMVRTARRLTGDSGRILYKAWDDSRAEATVPRQIEQTIRDFERQLTRRLEEAG